MPVIVVEPPTPILDAATLRKFVPGLAALDDDHLILLISVAQQYIEPPNSWVGRSFGRQTLELVTDEFVTIDAHGTIPLPFPPISSVASISYEDPDGERLTLPPELYRPSLVGILCGIRPAAGQGWPRTSCSPDAVKIRFLAGYADSDPELLPAKQAVALAVQSVRSLGREDLLLKREKVDGISEREWVVSPQAERMVREASERLLQPYRIYL